MDLGYLDLNTRVFELLENPSGPEVVTCVDGRFCYPCVGSDPDKMARPARFELATLCLEGRRSIQLSYGRISIDFKTFAPSGHILLDTAAEIRPHF